MALKSIGPNLTEGETAASYVPFIKDGLSWLDYVERTSHGGRDMQRQLKAAKTFFENGTQRVDALINTEGKTDA